MRAESHALGMKIISVYGLDYVRKPYCSSVIVYSEVASFHGYPPQCATEFERTRHVWGRDGNGDKSGGVVQVKGKWTNIWMGWHTNCLVSSYGEL